MVRGTYTSVRPAPAELLTIEAAADRVSMSTRYVRRLIAERCIVFYRLGRSVRIDPADLAAHIVAGRVEPITRESVWRDLRRAAAQRLGCLAQRRVLPRVTPFWHCTARTAPEASVASIGVPALHFHDLRHTGNTLAATTGTSLRDLTARAALIYQHAMSDADRAVAAALDALLRAESGSPDADGTSSNGDDDGDDGGAAGVLAKVGSWHVNGTSGGSEDPKRNGPGRGIMPLAWALRAWSG